jgi:hypothetical protein
VLPSEVVLPAHERLARAPGAVTLDLEGPSRPRGSTLVAIAPNRGGKTPSPTSDEARLLLRLPEPDPEAALRIGLILERGRKRVRHRVGKLGLECRIAEPRCQGLGQGAPGPGRNTQSCASQGAELDEISAVELHEPSS